MKKIVAIILSVILGISGTAAFAQYDRLSFAEQEPENPIGGFKGIELKKVEPAKAPKLAARLFGASSSNYDFKTYIKNAMKNHQTAITFDLADRITENKLINALQEVCYGNYDVMAYTGGNVHYEGSYITVFYPDYILSSKIEDDAAVAMMDAEIERYLEAAEEAPDLLSKILVIHDKMCSENRYGYESVKEYGGDPDKYPNAYTAYGFFKDRVAVCQGNSIAFKAIMDKLNERLKAETGKDSVECAICTSSAIGHMWNAIKIDGKWYYFDETWDDADYYYNSGTGTAYPAGKNWNNPEINQYPLISLIKHSNFLVPLANMGNHEKEPGDSVSWRYFAAPESISCTDSRYSSGYIYNMNNAFRIEYNNGMYEIFYQLVNIPFKAKSLEEVPVLISDAFNYSGAKAVLFYTNEYSDGIDVYRDIKNGKVESDACGLALGTATIYAFNKYTGRLFAWKQNSMEPLTRSIDVK